MIAAYVKLTRADQWPSDQYLEMCADYQAQFIGGERFRNLAEDLLAQTDQP